MERILCPIDFSESSVKAYGYAQSLAGRYGSTLFVLHVVDITHDPYACWLTVDSYHDLQRVLLRESEEHVKVFIENHTRPGLQPEGLVSDGMAADCILDTAREKSADLVVMGTHGRRGLNRLMLGSVAERVLRNGTCPVLVVHGPAQDSDSSRDNDPVAIRRILACTDFSEPSQAAVDRAMSIAAEYRAELTVLHVVDDCISARAADREAARAERQLAQGLPANHPASGPIKTLVRSGTAYARIVEAATETCADLIVMGVRGRNVLDIAVFGSTTYRVVQLGSCPVLVVHATT